VPPGHLSMTSVRNLLITGKLWPQALEVELVPATAP
jgi:glutamine cyclotransferase